MKFIKYLAWLIVGLFVLIPTIIGTVVGTTTGSVWLINQSIKFTNFQFDYEAIEGNLLSELHIRNGYLSSDSVRVEAVYLELSWQPLELLDNKLVLDKVVGEKVNIWLKPTPQPTVDTSTITLPDIALPLELRVNQLRTRNITVYQNARPQKLPDITASLTWFKEKLSFQQLELNYQNASATINGQVTTAKSYPLNFQVQWLISDPHPGVEIENIAGTARLAGNTNQVDLSSEFSVTKSGTAAGADTLATDSNKQHIEATINNVLKDPTWSANVNLSAFRIGPILPLILTADSPWMAYLQQTTVNLQAHIDQQKIRIERAEVTALDGQNGRLRASGYVHNYLDAANNTTAVTFSGTVIGSTIQLPESLVGSTGTITAVEIAIDGDLSAFRHNIDMVGDYNEYKNVQFATEGTGSATNIALAKAQVQSQNLSATFTAQADWSSELAITVDIDALSANVEQLADYGEKTVTAQGAIRYQNSKVRADEFIMRWASNTVSLTGAMRTDDPLRVTLQIPTLDSLKLGDYFVGSINGQFAVSGEIDTEITVAIDEFSFNHPDFGEWQSINEGRISIPVDKPLAFAAEAVCIASTGRRNTSEICANTNTIDNIQTTNINGKALPLALVNRFRDETVAERIWGLANLDAQFQYSLSDLELIHTSGRLHSEQTILFALDEEVSTRLAYWDIEWRGDTTRITSSLIAQLENDEGTLLGELSVVDPMNVAEFDGEILLDVSDLTILQWVLPDLRYENAQAVGSITIKGNKATPEVKGSVELAAQEVGFAQTGLVLTNVRIAAYDDPESANSISLTGQAESGDGWISINGSIQPLAPALNLTIKGDNFRALQLPTATIDISPNITIALADKRIDITGEVSVPNALIDQPEIEASAVAPSGDVYIYENGEQVEIEQAGVYPLYANVRVSLGDDVKVRAFGFDGKLAGSIRVIEAPNRALTATGSIQVKEGFYELYGQRLEIDRGSLIYSGGPINNPGLDLRASRAKENLMTTENINVGAQVNGTLQEPEFRLFSSPAMPDSEVLSYLILGRGSGASTSGNENLQLQALILLGSKGTDILGESLQETFGLDEFGIDSTMNPNDTSFYIGKYLSPKLYVKYGVGLFENTNTFLVRYLLSERFIIETTASSEAQGGDIFYTIEK